jgi:hypothetical protein
MADFRYDDRAGRFRDSSTGRFVSERQVRDAVDATVSLASEHMATLSSDFRAGTINAAQFLDGMLTEIKSVQIASALAAYGGRDQMTQSRWGYVGSVIREQYAYARQMVADVLDGKQRMNGRLDARARQYANSGRTTYENIRRREMALAGMAYELNVQHSDEGCEECVAASDRGWVPIGTLPPVGARICRGACLCTLAFAATRSEAEAA